MLHSINFLCSKHHSVEDDALSITINLERLLIFLVVDYVICYSMHCGGRSDPHCVRPGLCLAIGCVHLKEACHDKAAQHVRKNDLKLPRVLQIQMAINLVLFAASVVIIMDSIFRFTMPRQCKLVRRAPIYTN